MQPFIKIIGPAAFLPLDNINTDVIIRVEHITSGRYDQLGHYALQAMRLQPDGTEVPDFVLNQPAFRNAPVLLSGRNFGCGSSRESAARALLARGIRCVVAVSFGDIFFNNCFQNGMLPLALPQETVARIAADAADGSDVTVDLQTQVIRTAVGTVVPFHIEARSRESLLSGLDDIGLTLQLQSQVQAWQARDRAVRPWIWR